MGSRGAERTRGPSRCCSRPGGSTTCSPAGRGAAASARRRRPSSSGHNRSAASWPPITTACSPSCATERRGAGTSVDDRWRARHHPSVIDVADLLAAVDDTFRQTSAGLSPWPDPHPDRSPPVDAYSRLTDPARWRILGARTDAWLSALAGAGLAVIDAEADVTWRVVQQP